MCACADLSDQSESDGEAVGGGTGGAESSANANPLANMKLKLKELTTAYDMVVKNSHQLSKLASELDSTSELKASKPAETLALLKLTSSAMMKVWREWFM